jgi:hypothetical protein
MMFQKVVESFQKSLVRKLHQGGKLCCPDCGAVSADLPASWDEAMLCPACGARASLSEWASASSSDKKVSTLDEAPSDTKIVRKEFHPDHVIWKIPASGKFGFLFVFAILWLSITALVSGVFLLTFLTGGEIEGDMPGWE